MEEEKLVKELKEFLSSQDKIIQSKVSKTVLSQTGVFFASLIILVGVWSVMAVNSFGNRDDIKSLETAIKDLESKITGEKSLSIKTSSISK